MVCVCGFTYKTKEGYNAHLLEMKRLTPEPSVYVCVCGDTFKTKEERNAHLAEVERRDTEFLIRGGRNLNGRFRGEQVVMVEEIETLTDVCSGKWLMQFVLYRQ